MTAGEGASELDRLRQRLAEAEETLHAIYQGAVDALVVRGTEGPQIFTLRGAQEPYRIFVERMNEGALTASAEGTILYSNRHFADLIGHPLEQIVGKSLAEFVAAGSATTLQGLLSGGVRRSSRRELALVRADGGVVPALVAAGPLVVDESRAILLIVTDLTQQKLSEEIAASERFARSILEQATDAVFVCDRHGRIVNASWAAERLLDSPLVGLMWGDAVRPAFDKATGGATPPESPEALLRLVQSGGSIHGVETRLGAPGLGGRHFLLSAGPLHERGGVAVGAIINMTEITERKRAEEHQTMLVAELNHRVKNILAVVQSVAWQTLGNSASLSSFKQAFDGRLKAISLAHDILTRVRWGNVDLDYLIGQSLAPYADSARRVHWQGPDLSLPSHVVVPLAMVLHELATNAAKYGAFAVDGGSLEVAWSLGEDGRNVELEWLEHDGPAIAGEVTPGFGSQLISRVVSYDLHGKAELTFGRDGFRCRLSFPMPEKRPDALRPRLASSAAH